MAESDDIRVFIRDLMTRFDKKMAATEAADRRRHAEVMAAFAADRERLEEIKAEGRAQREALFRILDKLDGRGGPAAAS